MCKAIEEMCEAAYQEGWKEGWKKGWEEGRKAHMLDTVKRMLAENLPLELIARIEGLSIDEVLKLKAENT